MQKPQAMDLTLFLGGFLLDFTQSQRESDLKYVIFCPFFTKKIQQTNKKKKF